MTKSRPLMTQAIAVTELENPVTRKGFALWERLRGTRRFPSRNQLLPRELSDILRNIVLVKVLDEGREYQFRIVGDAMVIAQGASFMGLTLAEIDEMLPRYGSMLRGIYGQVYETREPNAYRGWFSRRADNRSFFHESLILPLGEDGKTVDHILVVGVYAFDHSDNLR